MLIFPEAELFPISFCWWLFGRIFWGDTYRITQIIAEIIVISPLIIDISSLN